MLCKASINQFKKATATTGLLPELFVNLNENSEASISGGISPIIDSTLIHRIQNPPSKFPMDGPGRGGTQ